MLETVAALLNAHDANRAIVLGYIGTKSLPESDDRRPLGVIKVFTWARKALGIGHS